MKVTRIRLSESEIREELKKLERKYKMSTAEFLRRYMVGELDGTRDYVRWMGLCRMVAAMPGAKTDQVSA